MTTEDKLKDYILKKYKSLKEFTDLADLKYSTFDSILKRGIDNANVSNIIKICKVLGISVDGLAEGELVPVSTYRRNMNGLSDVTEILDDVKSQLYSNPGLTLDGSPATRENIESIVGAMDVGVELAKRNNKKA